MITSVQICDEVISIWTSEVNRVERNKAVTKEEIVLKMV